MYIKAPLTISMINHSKPIFDNLDRKALGTVLDSGFATSGPRARQFGTMAAGTMGMKWGIPVQSGTDALVLALQLLKLPRNAKIAIPAYSCGAVLDALAFHRLTPVPIDISRDTLGISIEMVNSSRCNAAIAAHLFGIAAPFHRIKIKNLVEDCAQCLGVSIEGRKVGSMGRLSTSSFYGTKIICTGHGGILCGDSPGDFRDAMEVLRHDKVEKWRPHLHFLMSDLNAALGISQLQKMPAMLRRRRRIAKTYMEALGNPGPLPGNEIFFRFNVVPAKPGAQSSLIAKFAKAGIEAKKPVYKPIFRLMGLPPRNFPVADWADRNLVSIPIYPALADSQVAKIAEFLNRHKDEIRSRPSA